MTKIRQNIIRKVKDIAVGSTFAISIFATMQSCDNNGGGGSYDVEETETYTHGVKMYIQEVSKGEFKITNEVKVPIDSAIAIVKYYDGKQDTLKPELAKALIDKDLQNNNNNYGYRHHSLSNALMYGGMGYMFSRMMGNNNNPYYQYRQRYEDENRSSGGSSGFYSSPKVYSSSQTIHESVGSSKVVVSRPVGSRSGFFHGSSHVSHVG